MTTLSINAIMAAMTDYANTCKEEGEARSSYQGRSWDWHGASYLEAVDEARVHAERVLQAYIAQEVAERVKLHLEILDK